MAAAIQLDVMQRRNARLGYGTPALDTNSPGGMLYGPSGAVLYGAYPGPPLSAPGQRQQIADALQSILRTIAKFDHDDPATIIMTGIYPRVLRNSESTAVETRAARQFHSNPGP